MKVPCDVLGLTVLAACVILALAAAPLALGADDPVAGRSETDLLDLVRRAFERTFERTHWERWHLAARGSETEGGRDCLVVEAVPQFESQYGRLLVWIDRGRVGVARIDFHRPGALDPFKRLRIALADAADERGLLHVGDIEVEQVGRDARDA